MDYISTRFIRYTEIDVQDLDPLEEAWGFNTEFADVIEALGKLNLLPGELLTENLMEKVRNLV